MQIPINAAMMLFPDSVFWFMSNNDMFIKQLCRACAVKFSTVEISSYRQVGENKQQIHPGPQYQDCYKKI